MGEVLETIADDAEELIMFVGLAMLFLGAPLGVFEVSVLGLVVLVGGALVGGTVGSLLRARAGEENDPAAVDPVAELQARYARGEVSEEEFERTLERLLETEDRSAGGDHAAGATDGTADAADGTADVARERDAESER